MKRPVYLTKYKLATTMQVDLFFTQCLNEKHWKLLIIIEKNIQKINKLCDEIAKKYKTGPNMVRAAPKYEDNAIARTRRTDYKLNGTKSSPSFGYVPSIAFRSILSEKAL
uniref:Uncharacterized protein n=1 Tax=Romanomermis culicivorax TaxID=13658 RepID=A0A915HSH0_ROMCU